MKNLKQVLIVVLIFTAVNACVQDNKSGNSDKVKQSNYTADLSFDYMGKGYKQGEANSSVSGVIENVTEPQIYFFCDSYIDTANVKSDGSFTFKLPINTPQYAKLVYDSKGINIFISPNDNLEILFNSSDIFNSIYFAENGSVENEYLKGKHLLMFDLSIPLSDLYSYPPAQFKRIVDSAYVVQKIFLDESLDGNEEIPEIFREMEYGAIKYERATKLFEYILQSGYYSKLDDEYFKFASNLSVNEAQLLRQYDYRAFLNAYIDYYSYDYLIKNNNPNYSPLEYSTAKMDKVVEDIESTEVKDYMMFNLLKSHVKYYGFKGTENLFGIFDRECADNNLKERAMVPFRKYMKLQSNSKAALVSFVNGDGEEFDWSNFKGKYIYVDVWATWCVPCKKESTIFYELSDEYKHKNIEFVSISIDSKFDDWKVFVEKSNHTSNQFILNEARLFLDTYQIKTVPHFLIIDEKGNLINVNADRPSEIDKSFFEELSEKMAG